MTVEAFTVGRGCIPFAVGTFPRVVSLRVCGREERVSRSMAGV